MGRLKANWYWRITDLGFVMARLERVSRLSFPQTWKKHSVETLLVHQMLQNQLLIYTVHQPLLSLRHLALSIPSASPPVLE